MLHNRDLCNCETFFFFKKKNWFGLITENFPFGIALRTAVLGLDGILTVTVEILYEPRSTNSKGAGRMLHARYIRASVECSGSTKMSFLYGINFCIILQQTLFHHCVWSEPLFFATKIIEQNDAKGGCLASV